MESREDQASAGAGDPRMELPFPPATPFANAPPGSELPPSLPMEPSTESEAPFAEIVPEMPQRKADPSPEGPSSAKTRPSRRIFGSFFDVSVVVLLALFLALLLKVYVAEAYEIRGKSMEPTFHEEQRVMILKVFYGIQRGDIIIFSSVDNPAKDLIKRVIGLPGDVVETRGGEVYVNGGKLEEPYAFENDSSRLENLRPEKISPGKYYVLGDNRPDSMDSRKFHPIDVSTIKGKVVLRWWPLEKLNSF